MTEEKQLFPLKFVSAALKKSKLPYTKPTIINYERMGVIKPGSYSVVRKSRIDRMYTAEEVGEVVRCIREYRLRTNK